MDQRCPACGGRLIEGPESRGAWGCTGCGGVWAGTSVSNQVVSVLDPALRDLADVAQTYADKNRGPRPVPTPRACPDCRAPLEERRFGSVTVDVCRLSHGTWFDRGELQRVSDERQGRQPPSPTAPAIAASGPPSDSGAADIAIGALGIFFAFLTD